MLFNKNKNYFLLDTFHLMIRNLKFLIVQQKNQQIG